MADYESACVYTSGNERLQGATSRRLTARRTREGTRLSDLPRTSLRDQPLPAPSSPGEDAGRTPRSDGAVSSPASGTAAERRASAMAAPRIQVNVSRARDCRECNGWGSLVKDGRAELCPACQSTTHVLPTTTVVLMGAIDMESAPGAARVLRALIASGVGRLVADLGGVDFMDTSAINALIRIADTAEERGTEFTVQSRRPSLTRLFRMTGTEEMLMTPDQAARSLPAGQSSGRLFYDCATEVLTFEAEPLPAEHSSTAVAPADAAPALL